MLSVERFEDDEDLEDNVEGDLGFFFVHNGASGTLRMFLSRSPISSPVPG